MRILILGGSPGHPGGVEAFCDRSEQALRRRTGWDLLRMPADTAYMTIRRLPSLIRGWGRLLGYKQRGLDCVWIQYSNLMDLTFVVVAKLFGFDVMVTPHLGANWRSQANPALRSLSGLVLQLADRLALISPTQELEINLPRSVPRSQIRNFLPSAVIEAAVIEPGDGGTAMRLIHSGRLSEGKGTFLFVDVCERLHAAGVPFSARITGGADEATYARLRAQIAGYGLENCIAVLGRISDSALLEELRGSDFLVHLSRIDSYPLIVLEAILCGTLPVCMELAGARDMVETYGGGIVSQFDPVAEAAVYLAAQDLAGSRRLAAGLAARVRADYAWESCAAALETALLACCEQGPRSGPAARTRSLNLALD